MNKNILIFFAAFLAGGGVGWIVTKRVLEMKYDKLIEEEIQSVKDTFEARRPRSMSKEDAEKIASTKVTSERPNNPAGVLSRSSLDNNPYEQAKRQYNLAGIDLSKVEPDGEPDEDSDEDEDDEPDDGELRDAAGKTEQDMLDLTKVNRTMPYLINDQEFTDEFDHHDKVSLYYYRLDDVLTEENEEIIDDIETTVGYDALATLDKQTTVWVRNEPLGIDYEIIGINKTYSETVLGIKADAALSPRERYERQQKRKEANGGK